MPAITRGKQQQEKDDLVAAKKLKPKLRKFLINTQVQKAAETANEQKKEQEALLSSDEIIQRAAHLAAICFYERRLWKQYPPSVEMKWLQEGWGTPALQQEMQADMAGFTTYLVREYRTYLQLRNTAKKGYLSPLDEKNLAFFWQKFNADLRLLIEADRRRVALGNQGVILVGDAKKGVLN